jgi:hypothetical protein
LGIVAVMAEGVRNRDRSFAVPGSSRRRLGAGELVADAAARSGPLTVEVEGSPPVFAGAAANVDRPGRLLGAGTPSSTGVSSSMLLNSRFGK